MKQEVLNNINLSVFDIFTLRGSDMQVCPRKSNTDRFDEMNKVHSSCSSATMHT